MRGWTLDRVLVIGGFITMALAVIIFSSADPSLVGPFLLLLLPGIVASGLLLWRPRRGFYLIAGLANSLPAMSAIPFGLFGALANPLLGPLYNAVVLATLSLVLALPAGVFGFLRGRPGFPERPLAEGIRNLQGFAVVAIVAVSLGAMVGGSLAYRNQATPLASPTYDFTSVVNVSILASNSRFTPNALDVTVSVVTRITILNEDDTLHSFTYTNNGTTFSHDLSPGQATRFFVLFSAPGTVPFRSVGAGDSTMNGTIRIVGGNKPLVTFSSVSKVNAVTWTFSIASAQPSVAQSNYKVNFGIGTNTGTVANLGTSNTNVTVAVAGGTPASVGVKWTDIGGSGTVKGGDLITIAFPSAPTTGTSLTFYLLYSDGSQVQIKQWQA